MSTAGAGETALLEPADVDDPDDTDREQDGIKLVNVPSTLLRRSFLTFYN